MYLYKKICRKCFDKGEKQYELFHLTWCLDIREYFCQNYGADFELSNEQPHHNYSQQYNQLYQDNQLSCDLEPVKNNLIP